MHQDVDGRDTATDLAAPPVPGQVVSVNVGQVRTIEWLGHTWTTAIWKSPVPGRLLLSGVNVAGDDQADRENHGGVDKSVYSYAREDAIWWEAQLGRPLEPGNFGENLTLLGVDVTNALVGERWQVGAALLEVSQPRVPCFKLGARMGDPDFPPRFAAANRPGAYLRIVGPGHVAAGDSVHVVSRPAHGLTVGEVANIFHRDHARAARLLDAPELSPGWRDWAEHVIHTRAARPPAAG
jgi:MOSC domain-containing protein YiiM